MIPYNQRRGDNQANSASKGQCQGELNDLLLKSDFYLLSPGAKFPGLCALCCGYNYV